MEGFHMEDRLKLGDTVVISSLTSRLLGLSDPQDGNYRDCLQPLPPILGDRVVIPSLELSPRGKELARIWNWGHDQSIYSATRHFNTQQGAKLVMDSSLLRDLYNGIYGNRFRSDINHPVERSVLFVALQNEALKIASAFIKSLHSKGIFESGRPIAHVVVDIIDCLDFLRDEAANTVGRDHEQSDMYEKIKNRCMENWESRFGSVDAELASQADNFSEYLSTEICRIFREVHNMLLFQLDEFRFPREPEKRCQNHPLLRSVEDPTFGNEVLKTAGLSLVERISAKERLLQEPLSDLRASIIHNGPFQIRLTNDPNKHLTVDTNKMRPTILVLNSAMICKLALLDFTDLMKMVGLRTYLTELLASHDLLFGSTDCKSIAKSLGNIDLRIVDDYRKNWSSDSGSARLSDFPIYGGRLLHIQQRMTGWRPVRCRDLIHRPYNDPVTYFALIFAILFGFAAIISVGLSLAQLLVTIRHP